MRTESYTVVIRREHTLNSNYYNGTKCPLYKAIREQIPSLPLQCIMGFGIIRMEDGSPDFEFLWFKEWNEEIFQNLKNGAIKSVTLTFSREVDYLEPPIPSPIKEKVIVKYVSVPESIREESKNLILS